MPRPGAPRPTTPRWARALRASPAPRRSPAAPRRGSGASAGRRIARLRSSSSLRGNAAGDEHVGIGEGVHVAPLLRDLRAEEREAAQRELPELLDVLARDAQPRELLDAFLR